MNGNASPAVHTWSTDAVPPAQRLDYWVGAVCEGFLEMDVTSSLAGSFGATLESAPLGAIGVNRVRGSAQDVYRRRRAIAQSRKDFLPADEAEDAEPGQPPVQPVDTDRDD